MSEHTPTPWRIEKDGSIWADHPELRYIGLIGPVDGSRVRGTAADRAFVRAACNSYGAVLSAFDDVPRQLRHLAAEIGPCLQAQNLRTIADKIEDETAKAVGKRSQEPVAGRESGGGG
jgi:hypothetical protein